MSVGTRWRATPRATRVLVAVGFVLGLAWLVVLCLHPGDQLQSAVLGVGEGALVGAIALSVTLTYVGSGVVNFAAAAVSMFSAFMFYDLRTAGQIFLPPPLPNLTVAHVRYVNTQFLFHQPLPAMPVWLAFAMTLVECVVLGLAFHFLVFRPLRHAPQLASVVASIGMLIVLQESAALRHPDSTYDFQSILPGGSWTAGSVAIPEADVVLVAIVVALAVGLWAVFRFTNFGLATRAAAGNERGAVLLGYNPNRFAAINWVASTVIAGAMGILVASFNGSIDPLTITLLIVPALAASLLGRFSSFGITAAAALVLGASQSWVGQIAGESWVPSVLQTRDWAQANLPYVLPFLVIVVVLFVTGNRLPTRGTRAEARLPAASAPRRPWLTGSVVLVVVAVSAFLISPDWRLSLQLTIIASIVCASLTVLTGFVGQISLMQMTIAGIAGFVLARFCDAHGIGLPFGPLIASAAATCVGLVAAIPALRIRGVNLAVVTLAAAVVIEQAVYTLPAFQPGASAAAQTNVSSPALFGHRFGPDDPWTKVFGHPSGVLPNPWFIVFCLVVAVLVLAGVVWLRRSRLGRRMLAVRSNERSAAAAGVSVAGTKVLAFAIAAFIAGIAGCLFSYNFQSVDPTYFSSFNSLVVLAVAYLGGIAMIGGSPIGGMLFPGALFATFLAVVAHVNPAYAVLVAGVGVVVAAVVFPTGIAGSVWTLVRWRARAQSPS